MRELCFAELFNKMYGSILIVALLLLCLTGIVSASQITVSGLVYGLWDVDTVLVTGDIRIPPDNELTINAGVTVLFDGPWQMKVDQDAKIVAVGTPSAKILFKPLREGDTWRGIRMEMCCGLSILDYCDFKRAAVAGTGDTANGGAIHLHKSSLAIYHCTFDSCSADDGAAIFCTASSSPFITDCSFRCNNSSADRAVLSCDSSSAPLIQADTFMLNEGYSIRCSDSSDCVIRDNVLIENGGGICAVASNPLISGNRIENNKLDGINGFGINSLIEFNYIAENFHGIWLLKSNPIISCNLITNNDASSDTSRLSGGGGIQCFLSDTTRTTIIEHNVINGNKAVGGGGIGGFFSAATIRYNWIANNFAVEQGGGIYFNSTPLNGLIVEHNTIAFNSAGTSGGGLESPKVVLRHSIVYGNTPDTSQVSSSTYSSFIVDSCDIQGGWTGEGAGNIDIDPQFRDTANGDFYATSGAITTLPLPSCGNEIPDSMEIWIDPTATAVIDHPPLTLPTDFVLSQNYPNPFNPSTTIALSLPYRTDVRLEIFNTLGQLVRSLCNGVLPAGETHVVWDSRDGGGEVVSSGVYYYRLTAAGRTLTRKMLLLK